MKNWINAISAVVLLLITAYYTIVAYRLLKQQKDSTINPFRTLKHILVAFELSLVLFFILYTKLTSVIGITANNLEKDARTSQKIDDTWNVSESTSKNIGAMLFYNDTRDKFTFSIYLNHRGFSFGYFYASGGATGEIYDSISKFEFDKNGSVLISMNTKKVAIIELNNDIEVTTINIDSTKPFAEVIPSNCGELTLYDINGNEVSMSDE
ncbi:MAG: hypothetical protein ACYDEX_18305 [Mobilitalea sp.]